MPVCSATWARRSSAIVLIPRCQPGSAEDRSRLPTTTIRAAWSNPAASETDEWQQVAKVDFTMSEKHSLFGRYIATSQFTPPPFSLEAAEQNLLVTRIGGRDNLAQTFTLGENYVINEHIERGSLCVQPHRHPSHEHRLLLRAGRGHQHLQLHAELHAAERHHGFQLGGGTESESTFTTQRGK